MSSDEPLFLDVEDVVELYATQLGPPKIARDLSHVPFFHWRLCVVQLAAQHLGDEVLPAAIPASLVTRA